MNRTCKSTSTTKDSAQVEGWILKPDPGIISRLKGCLSNHQQKQLYGVSCYLYGIRGSDKTHTGAVTALVQAVENPSAPERIFNHSGTDSYAMAIVGDQVEMLLERLPENIRGRFKQRQSNQHHQTLSDRVWKIQIDKLRI